MNNDTSLRAAFLPAVVLMLAMSMTISGCAVLGLGAAAGAAVGGCSILDENNDERITRAELSSGLFDSWDTDEDDALTEDEFESGIDRRETFNAWSGDFDSWDADDNDAISEAEFETGVAEDDQAQAWMDDQCDDLGL